LAHGRKGKGKWKLVRRWREKGGKECVTLSRKGERRLKQRRRIKRNFQKLKWRRAFSRIGERETGRENTFCLQQVCI